MSTILSTPLTLATQIVEFSPGYQGNLMNCIGMATRNVPVNTLKPIIIPFYEFSEKNPLTTEKTNIFASIAVGFTGAQIRLFRIKYDVVVGYDDPTLPYIQKQFAGILAELSRNFEKILFRGINPEYGLQKNSKTVRSTAKAENIDQFVAAISEQLEDMVRSLGKSEYSLYFPLGWYGQFGNVSGTPADQYCADALLSRASRMGISLSLYDSDVVDSVYIVKNNEVDGYFGRMPMLSSTIEDTRREEYVYRFSLDTPALVVARTGAVRAIDGLVSLPESLSDESPVILRYSQDSKTPEVKRTKK